MLEGAMILAGGILLLTRGFISDAVGLMRLSALTRHLIKHWARKKIHSQGFSQSQTTGQASPHRTRTIEAIEDAEFHEYIHTKLRAFPHDFPQF